MAVIITDTRNVISDADATTGWTASAGVAVFTSDPDPVETTGSLGTQVSNALEDSYQTITSTDISDTLVYCWLLPGGVLDDNVGTSSGDAGVQIYVGDGTNNIGYAVGGSNASAFRHNDGPVLWQCFLLDTATVPTTFTTYNGSEANLNFGAITRIGNAFRTLQKSVGGVENCFMDISFFGNGGLIITGGGTGTEGKFSEIAALDRSEGNHPGQNVASSSGAAYGIMRQLGAGAFGLQGPLTFGDAAGTGSVDFDDDNDIVIFEDRGINTNKYGITITGNATGTTSFVLGTAGAAPGEGSNGCTIVVPSGVGGFFTASNANIDTIGLYGCNVSGFDQSFTLSSDATTAVAHEYFANTFFGCAQIVIGLTEFKNNTISNTVATGTAEGAVLISDTTNISNLEFISGGTGHAIEIADATNSPFSFNNFTYSGYATNNGGTGNEALVNTSGSPITINVTGEVPSIDTTNSTGTVTIVASSTITVSGLKDNTEVRVFEAGTTTPAGTPSGVENATTGTTDDRSFTFNISNSPPNIDIRIFNIDFEPADILNFSVTGSTTLPVDQKSDRVYDNPP